jgi:protein phosphatase
VRAPAVPEGSPVERHEEARGRRLILPPRALVVLVGVSGAGKSTFAARHFAASQVVSSDHCRVLVGDDAADQSLTDAAFAVLHLIVEKRLELGRFTVVDATNVESFARRNLVGLARDHHVPVVAIVLDVTEDEALTRNLSRADRQVSADVVHRQMRNLVASRKGLSKEGFGTVYVLKGSGEVDAAQVGHVR